jgi:hypothetical protein
MSNHAHFLLRSGPGGAAHLMLRLLTVFSSYFFSKLSQFGNPKTLAVV